MKTPLSILTLALIAAPATATPQLGRNLGESVIDSSLEMAIGTLEAGVVNQKFATQDFANLHQLLAARVAAARPADPAGHEVRVRALTLAKEIEAAAVDPSSAVAVDDFVDLRQTIIHAALRQKIREASTVAATSKVPDKTFAAIKAVIDERLAVSSQTAPSAKADHTQLTKFLAGIKAAGANLVEPPIIVDDWNQLGAAVIDQQMMQVASHAARLNAGGRPVPPVLVREQKLIADRAKVAAKSSYAEAGIDQKALTGATSRLETMAKMGTATAATFKDYQTRVIDMAIRASIAGLQTRTVGKALSKSHVVLVADWVTVRAATSKGARLNAQLKAALDQIAKIGSQRVLTVDDFSQLNILRTQLLRNVVEASFSGK